MFAYERPAVCSLIHFHTFLLFVFFTFGASNKGRLHSILSHSINCMGNATNLEFKIFSITSSNNSMRKILITP